MLGQNDIKQAQSILQKSEKVFLALPPAPDADMIAAAELITWRLIKIGKVVSVSSFIRLADDWKFLPLTMLSAAAGVAEELLITIDTKSAAVGELRYEKSDNQLTIILSPKDKPLSAASITIGAGAVGADCIITIGAASLDQLGDLFHKNPRLFFETPVINLDQSPANDQYGEINLVDIKASALAEVGWRFVKVLLPDAMSRDEATLILAGIMSKTENFLDGKVLPETLALVVEALAAGGERALVLQALDKHEPLPILQLWGRAVVRTRPDTEHSILISIVTADDFTKTGTSPKDIPAILRHFEDHFHLPKILLILWQDPESRLVHAGIKSADPDLLLRARRILAGKLGHGLLFSGFSYSSFPAAEKELQSLLLPLLTDSSHGENARKDS